MRNKNGVFTNRGIHALCALPHTLQVISKCLQPCGICLCMRATLSQQPLHAHVGVQLEYTHMLPYAGTVQSCTDDISPGAGGTTGKICRKSSPNTITKPPKGRNLNAGLMTAMMSYKDLLTASKTCLCIMTTSSHTLSVAACKSVASSESLLM